MASIVDLPEVNPDWCGLRCVVSRGFIRANRMWVNTLPGTELELELDFTTRPVIFKMKDSLEIGR